MKVIYKKESNESWTTDLTINTEYNLIDYVVDGDKVLASLFDDVNELVMLNESRIKHFEVLSDDCLPI